MKPKITIIDISKFMNLTPQAIHAQVKVKNIKSYRTPNKINYLQHEEARELLNIKVKPSVIAFELVKGGVGKTSLSFHCAVRASLYGLRCAIIDLDQQANLTRAFGINETNTPIMIDVIKNNLSLKDSLINVSNGIDLLPSSFENAMLNTSLLINNAPLNTIFKDKIEPLKNYYDLIFIDCPPDLGAAVTATALASDLIIAPIEPDRFSISGLELTVREINNICREYDREIPIRIVINKYNTKTTLSSQTLCTILRNDSTRDLLLKTLVNISQEFPNCFDRGVSVFETFKKSTAKEDIDLLARELIEMLRLN